MQFNLKIVIIFALTYFATSVKSKYNNTTEKSILEKFAKYQVDFEKHYENEIDEERGFTNFANNLANINDLNAEFNRKTNNTTFYKVNKYTDEDPEEFDEHYGFKIMPYSEVNDEAVRSQVSEKNDTRSVKDAQLYDLYKADQLYDQFLKQFNKTNATNEKVHAIRYYRFIKTLVEINKNNLEGKALRKLDNQADKIQKPHEYFN